MKKKKRESWIDMCARHAKFDILGYMVEKYYVEKYYEVTEYRAKTIVEFINEVLENEKEWGYIEVKDEKSGPFHWCTRIEYRYGELLNEIPDAWQYREIKEVTACGGWSRMDYRIIPVR